MDTPLRLIETVGINGLTLCHKHSGGWVRSTLPDVCKAPAVPVPFVNVAFAKDLAKGNFPTPSNLVPPLFPWQGPRPAGAWCRQVAGVFGPMVWECKAG
jgi:hypothetical protein